MNLKTSKPIKVQTAKGTVIVRPHQTITVNKVVGKRLLENNSTLRRTKG